MVWRCNLHYEKYSDGTVKCIEDEIPFEIPDGCSWARFSNILELLSGQDLTRDRYNDSSIGIPYITGASNLLDGKVVINRWTPSPTTHATAGDLLLTVKGSGVGKMALFDLPDAHIARQIMALRCNPNIYRLYLAVLVPAIVSNLTSKANGIIPGISRDTILKERVPIPPFAEQKRIYDTVKDLVDLINQIDKKRDLLEETISIVKAKILDLAIRGKLVPQDPADEPASVLLERIRADKEEQIKAGKIKRDKKESFIFRGEDNSYYLKRDDSCESLNAWDFGDLPNSWCICLLGEVCDYGNCINVDSESIADGDWVLDLEDIEKDTGKVITRVTKRERDAASTKHKFNKGQVLYSKLRPYLNKVVLADGDGYCTSEIIPLEFAAEVHPAYARYYLMSPTFLAYANRCSYGVKMPRLSTEDGRTAAFIIPPYREQVRIAERITSIFEKIDLIQNEI